MPPAPKDPFSFCDLSCRFARVPEQGAIDGSGSCRTFTALYCEKKRSLVPKSLPCAMKRLKKDG